MTNELAPWRRRLARILLGIGAIVLIALLDAWRRHGAIPGATRSITLIVLLLAVSIPSAIALRRWPRATVTVLAIGSIYVAVLMTWTLYLAYRHAMQEHGRVSFSEILSIALTLGILATIPIALALAWPVRRDVIDSERKAAITPDN